MRVRLNWSIAIILGVIALTCLALCFVWPTPWVYTQDRARRINRFTQIPEWRYPDGTYKPPQDISGYAPVAQFSPDFLWRSLQQLTLPSDRPKPQIVTTASKLIGPRLSALTPQNRQALDRLRRIRCGMSAHQVRHILGEPTAVWGVSLPNSGHLLEHWDYSAGEVDLDDGNYVVGITTIYIEPEKNKP